jgi:hypothetical protein
MPFFFTSSGVRSEISQVAEFAVQNTKVARSAALAAFLKSFDEGRRLRLRCRDALRRRLQGGLFSNKKGQWLNSLKSLKPKRQIQAVNRQERAI